MDEADLKYLEGADSETPGWKKQKRARGAAEGQDDSLEGMIGAKESTEGVKADGVANEEREPAALMSSGDLTIANRLDRWNINLSLALVLAGMLVLAHDYLRRANLYQQASLPLPLPSALRNAVTPLPAEVVRPDPPRRATTDELLWLLKRGESFVCFASDNRVAEETMTRVEPLADNSARQDVIRVSADGLPVSDEFVFDALWHNRASFVIDDHSRADHMLESFARILAERRSARARARQTFHLVWDRKEPLPAKLRERLVSLLGTAGGSLFQLRAGNVS
jgi:hypothetical protein